jgi:hypothetical protein
LLLTESVLTVPIIAIFTKVDVLELKAFSELLGEGVSRSVARQRAPGKAEENFEKDYLKRLQDHLQQLKGTHPPVRIVQLRSMFPCL